MDFMDRVIAEFDKALRSIYAMSPATRPLPGGEFPEAPLSERERAHAVALMRVNHCGEICAQALYQGQALTSHDPVAQAALTNAAYEETEHLNWTETRISELGGRKSLLNPLWYSGALGIGILAGMCGDEWNLGFLAETERQVEDHLASHMNQLAAGDLRSRAIVQQMKLDEAVHATMARQMGGRDLPLPVRVAMKLASGVMTRTAYYI